MSGDMIDSLPTDNTVLTHSETQLMEHLFKHHHTGIQELLKKLQDLVLLALIFMLISLPMVDEQISKFMPITGTSVYIMIMVKSILFVSTYFILKNLYLVRKKD